MSLDCCDPRCETPGHAGLSRRRFPTWGSAVGGGLLLAAGGVTGRLAFGTPNDPSAGDTLVVLFLRGGADGLSLVPPFGEQSYYDLRPGIAVPRPGQANGALDLNGFFGLHPAMAPLYDGPWSRGQLAVVNATGWPREVTTTRSHFEAQDYWERSSTSPGVRSGWVARHLAGIGAADPVPALGWGSSLQVSLRGFPGSLSTGRLNSFGLRGFPSGDVDEVEAALATMYAAAPAPLGTTATALLGAIDAMAGAVDIPPGNGVTYPSNGLSTSLREVAQVIRANVGLRAAALDVGGWDLHDDMGTAADGPMAGRAGQVAEALAAFADDLGPLLDEVSVVVMSEFGRTSKENGNGGTDHGRGSSMLLMGGGIRGGLYGEWPTLLDDTDPDRDLTVTTDFRTVLAELLTVRLQNPAVDQVFPGFTAPTALGIAEPETVAAG
ncbi:MAG: DUF1501 domain-containing protein [Acidimicrobiia bacterium]|nr:DUF1501 domain-containing protein [Acidimicrobiia bacterium]